MLGLNADTQGDEAAARAARHGWTWPQAKLGYPAGWEVRQKFAAYQLPSIWLIGPDSRVIARDLRGAAIKETVSLRPPEQLIGCSAGRVWANPDHDLLPARSKPDDSK